MRRLFSIRGLVTALVFSVFIIALVGCSDGAPGAPGLPGNPGNPGAAGPQGEPCLLYTSPSPRDGLLSRMPSSA